MSSERVRASQCKGGLLPVNGRRTRPGAARSRPPSHSCGQAGSASGFLNPYWDRSGAPFRERMYGFQLPQSPPFPFAFPHLTFLTLQLLVWPCRLLTLSPALNPVPRGQHIFLSAVGLRRQLASVSSSGPCASPLLLLSGMMPSWFCLLN